MKSEIENRLVVEIAKGLPSVLIKHNVSIQPSGMAWVAKMEKSVPDDILRKCARFCGGNGFSTFIRNEIIRKLRFSYKFDGDAPEKKLISYPDFSDTLSAAHDIVRVLADLPYQYRISVGLPLSFSKNLMGSTTSLILNKDVSICTSGRLPRPFPLTSDNENFSSTLWDDFWSSDDYETELNENRLYLTSSTIGYSGSSGTSLMAREFEDNLRAFYGAGLALDLFTYDYISNEKEPPIVVHREDGAARLILAFKELEGDLWSNKEHFSTKNFVIGKRPLDINLAIKRVSQIFKDETSSNRLFTACIWYFRAKFSQRPLDKLLESTIAIEVILGDRDTADGIGLTKLLGNRCAYMLGSTNNERSAIQQTFTELYKLRSSIVHSGKHRADQKEAQVVNEATTLCGRIIAHELIAMENEETDSQL